MRYVWWEKTVEYLFVKNHLKQDSIVAPLAGKHEKAGDAIFCRNDRWILLEFKREQSDIESEKKKFASTDSYEEAKAEFQCNDHHHLIIFGDIGKDGKLQLNCNTYFSGKNIALSNVLSSGTEREIFCEYLNRFIEYKLWKKEGGGGGNVDYSHVIGVNESGEAIAIMSLSEFSNQFPDDTAELRSILTPEPQSSSPSMPTPF